MTPHRIEPQLLYPVEKDDTLRYQPADIDRILNYLDTCVFNPDPWKPWSYTVHDVAVAEWLLEHLREVVL